MTLTRQAAIGDEPSICKKIIVAGCDTESTNPHGCTALHAASQYNSAQAVSVLLELGAEIEAATTYVGPYVFIKSRSLR
jgi:ankyrin repeat protein